VQTTNSQTRETRSLSFSSEAMVKGSFPPAAHVWPPYISILLYFAVCPSEEAVREVCGILMFYHRFRSTAVKDPGE